MKVLSKIVSTSRLVEIEYFSFESITCHNHVSLIMSSIIREIFSLPYSLLFLDRKNESAYLKFLKKICIISQIFPISIFHIIWGIIRVKNEPEGLYLVTVCQIIINLMGSVTIYFFGQYQKKQLHHLILRAEQAFKLTEKLFKTKFDIQIKLTKMRRVANVYAAIEIAIILGIIIFEWNETSLKLDTVTKFIGNIVIGAAYYSTLWVMLAWAVDCCLLEIHGQQLSILLSNFKNIIPRFNIVSLFVFENASNLSHIFGPSRLLFYCFVFFNITFGICAYVSARFSSLDIYLYTTGWCVCHIFAILNFQSRLLKNVSI